MPPENPALAATVGARETEGVAGHFLPVLTGEEEGGGRHTHPCFGNALAWLAFYHDALEYGSHGSQRSVVLGGLGSRWCGGGGPTFFARTRLDSTGEDSFGKGEYVGPASRRTRGIGRGYRSWLRYHGNVMGLI